MPPHRTTVSITETDVEYLLSINAAQKDRAKRIAGYKWDPERVCWVYPRTARTHDALLAEFGGDVVGAPTITRPVKALPEAAPGGLAEDRAVQETMRKLVEEALSGAAARGQASQLQALQAALAARESELAEVRRRIEHLEKQLSESLAAKKWLSSELERLRGANRTLQAELADKAPPGADPAAVFERTIRETAKDASGREPKFCSLADRLAFSESLPLDLGKELERELRRILHAEARTPGAHKLLARARAAGLLTERGVELADVIRKQRNVLAHEHLDKHVQKAQIMLCFFAAAMLWPEFAE